MSRRARLAATLAAAALLLTACAGTDAHGNKTPADVAPHYVDLPDERTVLCIWEGFGNSGGLSCDWAHAR